MNKLYVFLALAFLPLSMALAADSVFINSITTSAANHGQAIVSGSTTYDTGTETNVNVDGGVAQTTTSTSWTQTFTDLKAGQHTATAIVNGVSASQAFGVPSNEGGIIHCLPVGAKCGLFAPTIPVQEVVNAVQPIDQMTEAQLVELRKTLIKQVIALLIQRVQELRAQLALIQ